ncbi:E3 ubiquitin-protein ligase RSL1 [Ziziphus jujuba]|nr:E3 ubiquitin-protein ligase RSL1 [Ziziphus jujuba]
MNVVAQKPESEQQEEDDHTNTILSFFKPATKPKKPFSNPSTTEKGESSNSKGDEYPPPPPPLPPPSSLICEICKEPKSPKKAFTIRGCIHSYCTNCVTDYVASKLRENILKIGCPDPGCRGGYLDPDHCRPIIPPEVYNRWGSALRDQVVVIVRSHRFYCPYRDCSMMMTIDDDSVRKSECPNCWRLICAKCRVPWHLGMQCLEFRGLNRNERDEEDITLMKPAQRKRRVKCRNCRFYVDRTRDKCTRCGKYFNNRNRRVQFWNNSFSYAIFKE